MKSRIAFLGEQEVKSDQIIALEFNSSGTLLDGDIVVVKPTLSPYRATYPDYFQGYECLSDDSSFRLRRDIEHWKTEINIALVEGKTVIVFLTAVPIVSIATGEKQFSGTGRNRSTTRIVTTYDPYAHLLSKLGTVVRRAGERVRAGEDLGPIASYWKEFGATSPFQVYIEQFGGVALLYTQTGSKTVAGIIRYKDTKGALVVLPPPDLDSEVKARVSSLAAKKKRVLEESDGDQELGDAKSSKARKAAEVSVVNQFLNAIVSLDRAARSSTETTPTPTWIEHSEFVVPGEAALLDQINGGQTEIERLLAVQVSQRRELATTVRLKNLLFEKGKPLEEAIIIALRILGFQASNYQDEDSEFDAVMTTPEGRRLIGEAEGRDDKAIGVDKLDQLERNLREDFAKQPEEGASFAQGVLFGNAFRLRPLEEREHFFTPKCLLAAERSKISLVKTTDLFWAARFAQESGDREYAARCRDAILLSPGSIVSFPAAKSL